MTPTKVLANESRSVEVTVWPVTFLTSWRNQMFDEDTFVKGDELWRYENRISPARKVRDLSQNEVVMLYHLDNLIKCAFQQQHESMK